MKVYGCFCGVMGLYGLSRGYRAHYSNEKERLTWDKLTNAAFVGFLYASPIWNIVHMIRLFHRLEIKYKGLNTHDYKINYDEFNGYCYDTI